MADPRQSRDAVSRDAELRVENWAPANLLPSPTPQPGWDFRYIRVSVMGKADPTNVSVRFREGWVPCKLEDHPELQLQADPDSKYKGCVEVGGLLLCKAPTKFVEQQRAHEAKQTQSQMESVDSSFMRQQDARMPLFSNKRTDVTFGRGRNQSGG